MQQQEVMASPMTAAARMKAKRSNMVGMLESSGAMATLKKVEARHDLRPCERSPVRPATSSHAKNFFNHAPRIGKLLVFDVR